MRYLVLVLVFVALMRIGSAQEDPREFTDAWQAYVAARESGPTSKTRDAAKEVLDIALASFDPKDERLPLLMTNYGVALDDAGDRQGAREILEQAVELSEEIHGKDADENIPALMAYADSLAERRNSDAQDRYYRAAMKIAAKNSGRDSLEYADIAFRAGVRIMERTRTTSGKWHLRQAHSAYVEILGESSEEAGLALFYLAKTDYGEGDYKDAANNALLALAAFDDSPEHKKFARALLVQAYEQRGMSDKATEHCLAIGRDSMLTPDQDYEPIFRAYPTYPRELWQKGQEGFVVAEFTVDEQGFVRDPVVVRSSGEELFEEEALRTIANFRYAPRFEDGEAVATHGVRTGIRFRLRGQD